jgi:hypothetical protein
MKYLNNVVPLHPATKIVILLSGNMQDKAGVIAGKQRVLSTLGPTCCWVGRNSQPTESPGPIEDAVERLTSFTNMPLLF